MSKLKILVLFGLLVLLSTACGRTPGLEGSANAAAPAYSSPTAATSTQNTTLENPAGVDKAQAAVDNCLNCHSSQQSLMETIDPAYVERKQSSMGGLLGQGIPLEAWQRVLVDASKFPQSIHGLNGCTGCHGGTQSPDKETAHQGIVANPSKDPQAVCGKCHPDVVANDHFNLHSQLTGIQERVLERSLPANHDGLEVALASNCSSCHATCGECHVSQPVVMGGGLVNGHVFNRKPSMEQNCVACHFSRAGSEFLGQNNGEPADLHLTQGNMTCASCHNGHDTHGEPEECQSCHKGPVDTQLPAEQHRYQGIQAPRCESCHPSVATAQDDNLFHKQHGAKLSCQVCHSVSYTNCDGCHTGTDAKTGKPTFDLEKSYFTFLIGKNPQETYDRPYEYVPLRHVPVARDTFSTFGKNLLSNFDKVETWTYATPHNIQLRTPQTATCNTCHGNPALFLTADKIAEDELKANKNVLVDSLPPLISSGDQVK